ncbi:general transcriptional corepressor trfA [Chrysoperla carnea]|uniref:general transcriptional corepressor trfA n=1 Tax=Chrysoperla carnea TaxID=189513 RepID=UPI001D094E1E|nr:general transcriptional corepressor trfA [Chrysoperla carnea]
MPRLRNKILSNSESINDSSIETFTPDKNKRKTRKQSENEDLFSISKLKNEEQMLTDESIEFVSLISPDIKTTTESEEEIPTKNISKRINKTKNSDTEKENEQKTLKTRNNRKSMPNNTEIQNSDGETNLRQLRSRKSMSKVDTTEDSGTSKKKRSMVSKKSNKKNLNSSNSDENNENDIIIKKTRKGRKSFINKEENLSSTLSKVNKTPNSNKQAENNHVDSNSDTEMNKTGSKKDKKSIRNRFETVLDGETSQSENNIKEVSKRTKSKRSTRTNEVVQKSENSILKPDQEINIEMNRGKSKVRRKSTRAQEISIPAVEDLITDDEDKKIVEESKSIKSKVNRRSTRAHENSFEAVKELNPDRENSKSKNQEIRMEINRTNEPEDKPENSILKPDQEINIEMNRGRSKVRRKSTRAQENSVSAVEDLITDDEDQKIVEETKPIKSKVIRRSTRAHENSFEAVKGLNPDSENPKSKDQEIRKEMNRSVSKVNVRLTRAHEDYPERFKDLTDSEDQEIDVKINQTKSKVNRRSTRAHENSFEAVKDLIIDREDSKDQEINMEKNRTSSRSNESSFEAAKGLNTDSADIKDQEIDMEKNESKLKVQNRRSTRSNGNSFEAINDLVTNSENSKSEYQIIDVEMNQSISKKDRSSEQIHENSLEAVEDLVTDSENPKSEESYVSMNRSKSRTDRRSTRIHESSFEVVRGLVTNNEDPKSEESDVDMNRSKSRTDRRSTRIHENSFEVVKDLITENNDTTFSPKSPKFQYQDTFTPTISGRSMRKSKYETSTPARALLSKSLTQKVNLNQTPQNISLIDLTNFTPRSIIKKTARTVKNSPKSMEKKDMKSQITLRKKRSISESDLTSARKSRVTFHPNTSVFHMDSLDSTLDDSEISLNIHSTSLVKESTSKKSVDFVSINPLNDTYDMEAFENQSADAIEENSSTGAHLSIKSNEEIDGVCKLNETFTPEEDKVKVRELSKRIKIHEKQPLVTDCCTKRKVFKKTPKRLIHSSVGSGLKKISNEEKTPAKTGTNNLQRNIKAALDNNGLVINKNDTVNSLKKTPSTSIKNQQPTPKRGTSVKKMPDFASIHKRNFEKMESLVENVKKRADRAKQLFSIASEAGHKDNSTNNHNKPTRLPVPANRLVATTATVKTPSKENTPAKANLKNTPGKAIIKKTPGKPANRFGFGLQNAKDKKELLKEEVKKKQVIRGDLGTLRQKDRQYIKGVRSNRRFDLLMQSRDCK